MPVEAAVVEREAGGGTPTPPEVALGAGARVAIAWLIAAGLGGLVDAVVGPALEPPRTLGLLAGRTLFGLASFAALGVGLAAPLGLGAWALARARAPRWLSLLGLYGAGIGLSLALLERTMVRQADALLDGRFAGALFVAFIAAVGLAPVAAHVLGALAAPRPRLRAAALVAAALTQGVHQAFFRDDYVEIHATVAVSAALLGGAAVAPVAVGWLAARRLRARVVLGALAALALLAGVGPTPNGVRKELFRSPGALGAWALAATRWEVVGMPAPRVPARGARFFRKPAEDEAPTPPTGRRLTGGPAPVVVFVTIDALRADVLQDRSLDDRWPALARLRDEGAHFVAARAPGSQTAVSLTATFSGRSFSELRWAKFGSGERRFEYAATDPTPRLAAMLADGGVDTFKVVSVAFLDNAFGVAPGFEGQDVVVSGRRHAQARQVEAPLVAWLKGLRRGPAFAFAHFMEPHAPYDRGDLKEGSKKERYLSEIAALDPVIARLREALAGPRLAGRGYLVLSADHGEAFGEHGSWEHTKTLYDELLRVPLLVSGPGVVPRAIEEPVTLMDVGPTVLDLFGMPTPAGWVGESLVPALRGEDRPLERPILAEGRLRRALVGEDGTKVIVDLRRKVVEAYDVRADPLELDDLWDRDPSRAHATAAALQAFFEARENREPGFTRVYKP